MTTSPQRANYGNKAAGDPTFHPSRDIPHMRGDTTSTGQQVFLDQGEEPARAVLFGKQGRTLWRDGDDTKYAEPENLSRLSAQDDRSSGLIVGLDQSKVPVSHWAGNKEGIHVVNKGLDRAEGYYRPSPNVLTAPEIGVEYPMAGQKTLLHEMGHAHHYDTVKTPKERGNPTKIYKDTRGYAPDPLKEGIADAYVDRYGGHNSAAKTAGDYSHISQSQFGYSSHYEQYEGSNAAWDDADRVLYAGSRAHFSETGEIPRYQKPYGKGPPGSATDATIHHLMQHSPHAREAWSQLNIGETKAEGGVVTQRPREFSDLAQAASRRHQDRRLLNEGQFVQESLFGEPEMARNQLGEIPRSMEQVRQSLGSRNVDYWHAQAQGIHSEDEKKRAVL